MSTESKTLSDYLRKAATEIEELRVQLALGKAEAHDKYEELKKKFSRFIAAAKTKTKNAGKSSFSSLRADLEELEVQLALGKAETRDEFVAQKKRIVSAMRKVERNIKSGNKKAGLEDVLLHEMETMRLKLEMLKVHYALGKMELRDALEKRKHDVNGIIATAKAKMNLKEFSERRQRRHAELKEAYRHLKKAYTTV